MTSDFRSCFLIGSKNTHRLSHSSRPYLPSLAGDSLTPSCVLNLSFPTAKVYILTTKIWRGKFLFLFLRILFWIGIRNVWEDKPNQQIFTLFIKKITVTLLCDMAPIGAKIFLQFFKRNNSFVFIVLWRQKHKRHSQDPDSKWFVTWIWQKQWTQPDQNPQPWSILWHKLIVKRISIMIWTK